MTECTKCLVSGRVQGVWYRAGTREQAQKLGLSGHARNLPDGRVEVLVCGSREATEHLKQWLWDGPPAADVSGVECEPVETEAPTDFSTR